MPSTWVDLFNQNQAAETSLARLKIRRSYEAGRRDTVEAANEGWTPKAKAVSPARSETFDPIAMIDRMSTLLQEFLPDGAQNDNTR